ncbi:TPA: hypothetical protein L2F03_000407 [Escherichia coli]|uniref:hypothetical protein n=1 Tax=Escherichia coli TaxID=562 RepID=UPI001CCBFDAC|nr:hypothetical protein [Escherichia coli]HBN3065845.1 hypothetical protein [Escherichia coli]
MSKSKLVKNNVESVSKEIKNEAEVIHENLSADEQTLSDVKDYQLLIETGQAEKISPKASGMLTWQLAISEVGNELYLRLVANGCGGLFSKDWISLSKIATVLETQPATGFSSGVFRPLFKGASANNAGFLAAVLRSPDICLLEAHPEKLFTHVLYPDWRERLNKLNTISSQEKITED